MADGRELVPNLHVLLEDNGHLRGRFQELVVAPEAEDLKGTHQPEEDAHDEEDTCPVEPGEDGGSEEHHMDPRDI